MTSLLNAILVIVLVLNLFALGTSRILAVIRTVGIQGALLGVIPLLVHRHLTPPVLLIVAATIGLKGIVIPRIMIRALREAQIKREVEPLIGLLPSIILGALATAAALLFAGQLPLAGQHEGALLVPTSIATVLVGFILLTTRFKALSQVVGYLVLENGIFIFGMLLVEAMPLVVEMGVLLDLFVGIFVICIIVNHINRAFSSMDTRRLVSLKEQSVAFALILFPLLMGAIGMAVPSNRWRPWLLPMTATAHLAMTVLVLARPELTVSAPWLELDPPGRIVLLVVSTLFFLCSFYAVGYLRNRQERSNRVFCGCLMTSLGVMSLVTWSHHLGLMWVAMEATTLVTAPLIYFNHTQRSIEATWKYLVVGSVGIALALLGTFFLAYASLHEGLESSLTFDDLLRHAPQLSKPWLHAAFVLLLVGYGTKMGLAPMHTWKPDAYGEAPGVVGAVLAGGVTNCAFLALLRIYHICSAAGEGAYASRLLLFMGLFSMAVAGLFMVGQSDFKRMLAYSSVEHMGILVLGLGIGRAALFGTLLHVMTNGMAKGVLFLSAGNIHRAYGSKSTAQVRGAMRRLPLSGMLFLAGFLAITGSPPFGPFISEFAILNGAFDAGRFAVAGLFLLFLLVVFIGMGATVLRVVQGRAPAAVRHTPYRDGLLTGAPVVVLMALVLLLGLYIPAPLNALINDAVRFLEERP